MQEDKIVAGLDIGTTKVCVIVGKLNRYGKLEVLGMGRAVSEGVREGTISNINKTVYAITQAIEEAENTSGIDIKVVNVGVAGKHIKSAIHHGGITRDSREAEISLDDVQRLSGDMYQIVTEPGTQIIHVMPQHYSVDYERGIKDPVGMLGVKLEADFHIITAQQNAIRNIQKCVERAGLSIESVILEPLASSLSVLSEEEKEAGVCIVDIGGGTTDLAIFQDGIIRHTAVIPFGGDSITSDIKQGCSVLQNQAEQLKVKFGQCMPDQVGKHELISIPGLRNRTPKEVSVQNLALITEARMEEIIELVHAEVVRSGYQERLAAGFVVTGGGALLRNLKDLFELKTGLDTRVGHPNEHLGQTKDSSVKNPMYSTGIGLVLAGFRNLDDREVYRQEFDSSYQAGVGRDTTGKGTSSPKGNLLSTILKRTRDLLIDDFDDKTDY